MRGFTLIETIIYTALVSLILVVSLGSFYSMSELLAESDEHIAIEEAGNFLLQKIESELLLQATSTLIIGSTTAEFPISSSTISVEIIDAHRKYYSHSFYIKEHFFNLSHVIFY